MSFADDTTDDYGREHVEGAGSYVINGQVNLNTVWTNLNAEVDGVEGDVVGGSVAVGNSFDSTTMRNTWVETNQYQSGEAVGTLANIGISNVGGSVGFTAQAVCNQANVSTDPTITDVKNTQVCGTQDPSAELNASVQNVVGDVSLATTAVGNTFQTDTNAQIAPVVNTQVNHSVVAATTNVNIKNVGGSVGLNASAIGNSATVVHY